MAWFASLDIGERCRLLTFEDRAWCVLAANMAARLDRRAFPGQGVRFQVQAPVYGSPRCVVAIVFFLLLFACVCCCCVVVCC